MSDYKQGQYDLIQFIKAEISELDMDKEDVHIDIMFVLMALKPTEKPKMEELERLETQEFVGQFK